jgi:4-hydroxy-3-polyprenylbenzoate decarboxylase
MADDTKSLKSKAYDEAAMGDLRVFLQRATEAGELKVIRGADPHLEIGTLFELSHEKLYPPVMLFENMKGCDTAHRILCNVRVAHFVVGNLDLDAVKAYRARPKEKKTPIPPRSVNTGAVLQNVIEGESVDVLKFPAPRWHQKDGGNYIGTECIVVTKDPDSAWVNLGTYRVMVHDRQTLGVFIEKGKHGDIIRRKYWAQGKPCPMAISVGQAPILGVVGSSTTQPGVSEYAVAGGRIGRPIDVIAGKVTGLPIPADAELVFEGFMPPPEQESRPEGPFGEWPGYYASDARLEPVMRVKAVYHRDDPIIIGQPPTKPTYPGRQIKVPHVAALWDALEAAGVPGVTAVWKMPGGGTRFIDVVAIRQMHAGHAKMAGLVAAGCLAGSYMTRLIIIVDDDVDVTNPAEVMWAISTRWDPRTQTDIIDGCWTGQIDPRLPPEKRDTEDATTSRMIMYAVRPWRWRDAFPVVNEVDRDFAEQVRRKWAPELDFLRKNEAER